MQNSKIKTFIFLSPTQRTASYELHKGKKAEIIMPWKRRCEEWVVKKVLAIDGNKVFKSNKSEMSHIFMTFARTAIGQCRETFTHPRA